MFVEKTWIGKERKREEKEKEKKEKTRIRQMNINVMKRVVRKRGENSSGDYFFCQWSGMAIIY